jgi:hypothetical protein
MRLTLLALCALIAGCALNPGEHWARPNATPRDLRMDEARCRNEAATASSGTGGLVAIATYEAVRRDCMIARGWEPTAD